MSKLELLRAKLKEKEERRTNGGSPKNDSTYRFWDMKIGDTATVRFLPDGNDENPYFWIEKQMLPIAFPGVLGGDTNKEVVIRVPCIEMYNAITGGNRRCSILNELRPMFDLGEEETQLAKKYWVKRQNLFHGFVVNDTLPASDSPFLRKFSFGNQIHKIIQGSLLDPDLEEMPTDYHNGLNFVLAKSQNGQYADYSSSKWSRKESAVSQEAQDYVDNNELPSLASYLPPEPTQEALEAQYAMFQASFDGELFDPSAPYAQHYRPYGMSVDQKPRVTTTPAPVASEPVTTTAPADSGTSGVAESILDIVRNR